MDKKTFEESLIRLFPESGREAVKHWFSFAEECTKMEQSPDFAPVSGKDAAIEKWLDATYKGLCRVRQEYGEKPAELICGLAVKHCLYPWEMMEAAKFLKNGGDIDGVVLQSVEGLLDECDAEKEACPPRRKGRDGKGGGRHVDAEILQGICKEQGTEKNACIFGQIEVVSQEENNAQNTGQT